jgi:hypothetical protein
MSGLYEEEEEEDEQQLNSFICLLGESSVCVCVSSTPSRCTGVRRASI